MLNEIRNKRELMINCANKYGYTNEETIKYSQELDILINQYQRAMEYTAKPNDEVRISFKQMILVWPKSLIEL